MSREIFRDNIKKRLEEEGIKTKRPEKIETILNIIDEVVKPFELEKKDIANIKKSLDMYDITELINLRDNITSTLSNKIIKDNDIFSAYDYIEKHGVYTSVTYNELFKYLHGKGIKKEFLDTKLVEMVKENKLHQRDGCPVGWVDTPENPIYPEIDGKKQYRLCYLLKR